MSFLFTYIMLVLIVVDALDSANRRDWDRIEHDLWLQEMRDKYPWPLFRL